MPTSEPRIHSTKANPRPKQRAQLVWMSIFNQVPAH